MNYRLKEKGLAALMLTITLLAVVTIMVFATADLISTDTRVVQNMQNSMAAFNAAQSGFDYALGNLNSNPYVTISDGTIVTGTLGDNSKYSAKYTYTNAGDSSEMLITSTGTSPDGIGTRVVQAKVKEYLNGVQVGMPVLSVGTVVMNNSSQIINSPTGNTAKFTIDRGNTVTINNSAKTVLNGTDASRSGNYKSDITPLVGQSPDSSLSGLSGTDIQNLYTGSLITDFQYLATTSLSFTSNTTFSPSSPTGNVISGKTGQIIYIDMGGATANFQGNSGFLQGFCLGYTFSCLVSSTPVTLVIHNANSILIGNNGNSLNIYGNIYTDSPITILNNAQISGLIVSSSSITVQNNVNINGAVVSGFSGVNGLITKDSSTITYNSSILSNTAVNYYAMEAGTWKDF